MPSTFAKISVVTTALAVLLIGAPAFAQSQTSSSNDPFSGVPAVENDQMSAIGGELAGEASAGHSTPIETSNCGAGAQCDGGVAGNAVGTTTGDYSASGNTIRVNVTAVNNQISIIGPSIINTSGGLNSASGGNAASGGN